IGLQRRDEGSYRAPSLRATPWLAPPHTIISRPVHTAAAAPLVVGAPSALIAAHVPAAAAGVAPLAKLSAKEPRPDAATSTVAWQQTHSQQVGRRRAA